MKSKIFKKVLSISLCLIMVFGTVFVGNGAVRNLFGFSAFAASGSCGDNLKWEFDEDSGGLAISGTGAMDDYSDSSEVPWDSYKDEIKKVTIGNSVTRIGNYAFSGCTSLTSITIGDSVTSIGDYAFSGCESLTSITIPDSVTSIGQAFSNCTSLTSIRIPDSVTSISGNAFSNTGYYNTENNWQDGVLYIDNCLIKAKNTISGDYIIKDGTKVIADDSFYGCTSLKSVTIGNSVTSIGDEAFWYCTGLKSVTIGNSVTSIDSLAFYNTGLTSVKIPSTVKIIEAGAFGCVGVHADGYYIYSKDFTIYCEKDSAAQRYAEANGLTCVIVSDPSTDNNSSDDSEDNNSSGGSSLYFFQRIIALFKNLFEAIKKLFS